MTVKKTKCRGKHCGHKIDNLKDEQTKLHNEGLQNYIALDDEYIEGVVMMGCTWNKCI